MAKGVEVPRYDKLCALCRSKEANEVGSHLAPNFIIHQAFSFDGTGKRDREISYLTHLNDPLETAYYGRQVMAETIEADLGHEMTDEEIDENINNLVYDYIFCKDCEKRFGILETEYSKLYGEGKQINPRIAYLFWLSVFWRMSIGYMAIMLDIHDELEIRNILNSHITSRDEIIASELDLGNFGYVVFHADGIMKGDSGIFGTRATKCPYIIIVNDLVVALVRDNQQRHRIGYKNISKDYVNSWSDENIFIHEISLEEFARMKRWIIDESLRVGYGLEREKVARTLQEECRSEGNANAFDLNKSLLEDARSLDVAEGEPRHSYRNMRRFWIGELKYHACLRLGKSYDILKDRSLFLFQFDIDNYKEDLIKSARKGYPVSHLPYAKRLIPRKYWVNEIDMGEKEFPYEETIDKIIQQGYTLNDIIEHNCCKKGTM